jgi:hypothetical protein
MQIGANWGASAPYPQRAAPPASRALHVDESMRRIAPFGFRDL